MATLNWEDVREVSEEEAEQRLLTTLELAGFQVTSWQPFSMGLCLVKIGSVIWNEGSKVAVVFKNAIYNKTAIETALTLFSDSHYDNQREGAVATQRLIKLSCATSEGPHVLDVDDVLASDDDGITFRNVEGNSIVYPVTLPSGGSVTLLFEAEEAGIIGNVPNGLVKNLLTTFAGVTITKDEIDRSGVDAESDARLQTRNTRKWSDRNELDSTADRAEFVALQAAPAVTLVALDDNNPRGEGTFDVYIAGLDATAGTEDIDAVQAAVDKRIMGATSTPKAGIVYAAPEVELDITGIVYHSSSTASSSIQNAVEGTQGGALLALVRATPLGGFDFSPGPSSVIPKNDIEAMIKAVVVGGVQPVRTVVLSTPSADFAVPSFGKVVRGNWNLTYVAVVTDE